MGEKCLRGQYWDALLKRCLVCHLVCQQPLVITVHKCFNYCESVRCKLLSGHHYDLLLKKCVRCTEVCGKHPAECSQHCQTTLPPVTRNPFPVEVTPHLPLPPEDCTVLLYALLALCLVLLFSSLSLALAVILRGSGAKSPPPRPKEAKRDRGRVMQPSEKVSGGHQGNTTKDYATNSSRPSDREPSDDSSPTETCVCIHCFPDLKTLGHGSDRPPRVPLSFNQHAVPTPHVPTVPKEGSLQATHRLHGPGMQVPGEGGKEGTSVYSVSNQGFHRTSGIESRTKQM